MQVACRNECRRHSPTHPGLGAFKLGNLSLYVPACLTRAWRGSESGAWGQARIIGVDGCRRCGGGEAWRQHVPPSGVPPPAVSCSCCDLGPSRCGVYVAFLAGSGVLLAYHSLALATHTAMIVIGDSVQGGGITSKMAITVIVGMMFCYMRMTRCVRSPHMPRRLLPHTHAHTHANSNAHDARMARSRRLRTKMPLLLLPFLLGACAVCYIIMFYDGHTVVTARNANWLFESPRRTFWAGWSMLQDPGTVDLTALFQPEDYTAIFVLTTLSCMNSGLILEEALC